jgi:hypothetical protein
MVAARKFQRRHNRQQRAIVRRVKRRWIGPCWKCAAGHRATLIAVRRDGRFVVVPMTVGPMAVDVTRTFPVCDARFGGRRPRVLGIAQVVQRRPSGPHYGVKHREKQGGQRVKPGGMHTTTVRACQAIGFVNPSGESPNVSKCSTLSIAVLRRVLPHSIDRSGGVCYCPSVKVPLFCTTGRCCLAADKLRLF